MIKPIKIICKRETCGHNWNYKGTSKNLVTCPCCLLKNKIPSK